MKRHVLNSSVPAVAFVVLAGLAATSCAGVAQQAPRAAGPDAFVGTWRLVEHSNWDSSGKLVPQFGAHPVGYFIHDETGHFSVQIMRTPAIRPSAAETDDLTPDELRELFQGYYASFGTYVADTSRSECAYRVEGSTRPQLIGNEARLPYRIQGDSLIIGDDKTWRRVWQRLR
jgi:hypothetical protein